MVNDVDDCTATKCVLEGYAGFLNQGNDLQTGSCITSFLFQNPLYKKSNDTPFDLFYVNMLAVERSCKKFP